MFFINQRYAPLLLMNLMQAVALLQKITKADNETLPPYHQTF